MTRSPDMMRVFLRRGLVHRAPRTRPRSRGEMRAMGIMAARRWASAVARGEIEVTPDGYRWNRGPPL